MKQLKDLSPEKLLAFKQIAKNIDLELKAAIKAFALATEFDPMSIKAFKELKELNDFILKESRFEYNKQTIINKHKKTNK